MKNSTVALPQKILITGASGFLGTSIRTYLAKHHPKMGVVPLSSGDFRNTDELRATLETAESDAVIHCAGMARGESLGECCHRNLLPTLQLFDAVSTLSHKPKVIIVGSAAEYGTIKSAATPLREDDTPHPISAYGLSKLWQTEAALHFAKQGFPVVVARVFNVLAPTVPTCYAAGSFAEQLHKIMAGVQKPVLQTGSLSAVRDYVDIEDVAAALMILIQSGTSGEIYNVCSGTPVEMGALLRLMIASTGITAEVREDQARSISPDLSVSVGCCQKLRSLGWRPGLSLQDSVERMLKPATPPRV